MMVAFTTTQIVLGVLALVCVFFFVLWIVIEAAVRNAREADRDRR